MIDPKKHLLGLIPDNMHSEVAGFAKLSPGSLSIQQLSTKNQISMEKTCGSGSSSKTLDSGPSPKKMKTKKRRKKRHHRPSYLHIMKVHFVCVSVSLNLNKFCAWVNTLPHLKGVLDKPMLDIDSEWLCAKSIHDKDMFQIIVTNTGCAVFWSCPKWMREAVVGAMKSVVDEQDFLNEAWDDLEFRNGDGSHTKACIKDDVVFLKYSIQDDTSPSEGGKESDEHSAKYLAQYRSKKKEKRELKEKMAISFALAQSIRIGCLEGLVQAKIKENNELPRMLATTGTINLNKREINRRIGSLFHIQAQVNLIGHALNEIPNWFWDQSDQYEETYLTVTEYLGISSRIEVLNQQLETIENLMQFISDQQNERHASNLEWLIIYLIVAEVMLQLGEMVINYMYRY